MLIKIYNNAWIDPETIVSITVYDDKDPETKKERRKTIVEYEVANERQVFIVYNDSCDAVAGQINRALQKRQMQC